MAAGGESRCRSVQVAAEPRARPAQSGTRREAESMAGGWTVREVFPQAEVGGFYTSAVFWFDYLSPAEFSGGAELELGVPGGSGRRSFEVAKAMTRPWLPTAQ